MMPLVLAALGLGAAVPSDPSCTVWFASEPVSRYGVRVHAEATVEAPLDAVLKVLEDFDHYAEYMPRVRRAERRPGNLVYTEIASPWPLKDVWFVAQVARERAGSATSVRWTTRSGNLRTNEGAWTLSTRADGRTRLRYEGLVELYHPIPPPLLRMVEAHELPLVVQAIRARAVGGGALTCAQTEVSLF